MDIIDYQIAQASSVEELKNRVCELIAQGWKPQGGLCCTDEPFWVYAQAMVKTENPVAHALKNWIGDPSTTDAKSPDELGRIFK